MKLVLSYIAILVLGCWLSKDFGLLIVLGIMALGWVAFTQLVDRFGD